MSNAPVTALVPNVRQKALKDLLERAKPSLAGVLPRHLTPDKLVRVALMATSRTPLLLECTPGSILLGVMQAAALGLEVGGVLGHGYLVPFKNRRGVYEAQFVPGYRGLIDLARRSGHVAIIEARVVLSDDREFDYDLGLDRKLVHRPGEGRGDMTHVYAIARFRGGDLAFEVMTLAQVEAIRKRSRASDSGPWVTDFHEMARKTVVKRLCKYLPLSVEMAAAVELDNRAETGEAGAFSEVLDIETPDVGDVSETTAPRDRIADKAKAAREETP